MFSSKLLPLHLLHTQKLSTKTITKATSLQFFQPEVQKILLNLIRIDLNKVFKKQKYGQELKPPEYKFLSTQEVEKLRRKAEERAVKKVQVPPVVPMQDDSKLEILSEDPQIIGHDISKFIFTDITFGISDDKRIIVVRETDGILREANSNERHRMNHIYFPRHGSSYKHPKMFNEENLLSLCNRKEYIFILDRACAQFAPNDKLYHDVLNTTFIHVNENNGFEILRSTRHFGSLVFFLVNNNSIDNLLLNNLHCNMLEDAVWLIQLYQIIHPNAEISKIKYEQGKEIDFIEKFISLNSHNKEQLMQALKSFTDSYSVISN